MFTFVLGQLRNMSAITVIGLYDIYCKVPKLSVDITTAPRIVTIYWSSIDKAPFPRSKKKARMTPIVQNRRIERRHELYTYIGLTPCSFNSIILIIYYSINLYLFITVILIIYYYMYVFIYITLLLLFYCCELYIICCLYVVKIWM